MVRAAPLMWPSAEVRLPRARPPPPAAPGKRQAAGVRMGKERKRERTARKDSFAFGFFFLGWARVMVGRGEEGQSPEVDSGATAGLVMARSVWTLVGEAAVRWMGL